MSFGRLGDHRRPEELARMTDHDRVRLLGELLARPGADTFAALSDLFSLWPAGPERSRQLARCVQELRRWDDDLRVARSSSMSIYDGGRLSDVARLARAIEIYRREDRGAAELLAVATSEYVSELTDLRIVASDVSSSAWQALVGSPHLANLQRLVVQRSGVRRDDVRRLFRSAVFPRLRTLELSALGLDASVLDPVSSRIPFPALETLDLSFNVLATQGALLLARAPWLAQLRRLGLRDDVVGRDGLEAVVGSPFAATGLVVDARDNGLRQAGEGPLRDVAARRGIQLLL